MAGEAEFRTLDQRVGGIERKFDELEKSLRAARDFKALVGRVAALEPICKVPMDARTELKAGAAKVTAGTRAYADELQSEGLAGAQRSMEQTLRAVLEGRLKSLEARIEAVRRLAASDAAAAAAAGPR